MQARIQTIATVLTAYTATVNGHITMKSPVPFGSVGSNKVLTTSPLTSANYPCQVGSNPATFYSKDGIDNKMEIGTPQKISFEGSAVHGGGSCQLALTKDPQPSASTSWQVILSIEGGCPSKTGNGVDEYEFTIPNSIEPGDWVLAWTWISKLSGGPEYYMNCAPLTLTGGTGKRDVSRNETIELFTRDGPLPELMVANLAEINDCKSQLSTDPTYPNPGPNVMTPGSSYKPAPIQGSNCVPKGAKEVTPGSGPSSGSSSSSAPDYGSGTSSAAAMSPTSTAAATTTASSAPGGVFVTSSETSGFVTVTIKTSTISTDTATSSAAIPSSSAFDSPSTAPLPSPSSSAPASGPSGSPTPGSGSGSGSGKTGACSTEGMFNCLDGTTYQQCASGSWSVVMTMPPTTKCALGESMTLWARSMSNDQGTRQINRRGY